MKIVLFWISSDGPHLSNRVNQLLNKTDNPCILHNNRFCTTYASGLGAAIWHKLFLQWVSSIRSIHCLYFLPMKMRDLYIGMLRNLSNLFSGSQDLLMREDRGFGTISEHYVGPSQWCICKISSSILIFQRPLGMFAPHPQDC